MTGCSEWLSEFLHADTSVLRGIKGVVCAGEDTSLEKKLDKERSAKLTLFPHQYEGSNWYIFSTKRINF